MSENDTSGQECNDVYECPVKGCDSSSQSRKGVGAHFGQAHDDAVKQKACLNELRRLADMLGHTPTVQEMDEKGQFSQQMYIRHFETWNQALVEAGFEVNKEYAIPEERLLDELCQLADELGHTPRRVDMINDGAYDATVYQDRFGLWNNALRRADLKPNTDRGVSDGALLIELHQLADELGHTPRKKDMDDAGRYCSIIYINRFGSWNDTLQVADLEPNKIMNIPEEDLLNDIRRIGDDLDRTPSANDMRVYGSYGVSVYYDTFKTWRNAVEDAGFEPLPQGSPYQSSEGHPRYRESESIYGPGWNEEKKEQVRERDGRTCQNPKCGRGEVEHIELLGRKHSVHHIQKARTFDDPEKRNHPDNLVTLCETSECHKTWEKMSPLRPHVI